MKVMKNIFWQFLVVLTISLYSCEKHETDPIDNTTNKDSVNRFVNELMHYWYFWNESVPNVKYLTYSEPQELMNDLMYSKDHWSFIEKTEVIEATFGAGEEFGYGFYLGWDSQYNLRVIISYKDSEAYKLGIRRGWIIDEIDDTPVKNIQDFDNFFNSEPGSMKFDFITSNNEIKTITLSKETFYQNAVHNIKTFDVNGKKTGYLAFQSFLDYSKDEFVNAFTTLKSEEIDELIIDLRFNGGGSVSIAEDMANILVPPGNEGKTFFSVKHNNIVKAYQDTSIAFESNNLNLNLSRVFFITNEYSASASELIINGLKPYMYVYQIGDLTHGKPFVMYGFPFQDWLAYPVTAQSVNADGFGDYIDGLVPDKYVIDNNNYDWGNEQDPAINQALNYIKYGNFDVVALATKGAYKPKVLKGAKSLERTLAIMDK